MTKGKHGKLRLENSVGSIELRDNVGCFDLRGRMDSLKEKRKEKKERKVGEDSMEWKAKRGSMSGRQRGKDKPDMPICL